jgi:hypothetical protein
MTAGPAAGKPVADPVSPAVREPLEKGFGHKIRTSITFSPQSCIQPLRQQRQVRIIVFYFI